MDPYRSNGIPDLDALARIQEDTVRNLARRYTAQGYEISPEQVDVMLRTIMGEAANESPAGREAVANTMLNRMAGGEKFDSLAGAYDANGLRYAKTQGRSGVPANSGFENTQPGQNRYSEAISALMRPQSRFSRFAEQMPDSIKTAKQYYNPAIASPKWGGSNFQRLGNHAFGNEFLKTSENVRDARLVSPLFENAGDVDVRAAYNADDYTKDSGAAPADDAPGTGKGYGGGGGGGWAYDYPPEADRETMTAEITGKPGGKWGNIFGKLGSGIGKVGAAASYTPDAAPKGPSSYVTLGEIHRPPQRPRKPRLRPTRIMEGVNAYT